jgi:hypothetical protein
VAAQNQVIVNLTANAKGFVAGTSQAQKALQNFNQGILASTQGVTRFRGANGQFITTAQAAKQVVAQLTAEKQKMLAIENQLSQVLSKSEMALLRSSGAVKGLSAGTGSASFALLSLGQAFQDSAQFGMGFAQGFRAINNNIQQTFTAIALGSVQMGGFNNLIKAMGGSLLGPGGLILAFSALSAGVEFFATRAQKAAKDADELAKSFNEAADSVFTFQDSLSGMSVKIPESAITPLRIELEKQIDAIDNLIAKSEESSQELFRIASIARSEEILQKAVNAENEIVAAKEEVATLDMDRIEGQRRLLALLKQQEGFLEKRNELLEIAKSLGLDLTEDERKSNERKLKGNQYLTESEKLLMKVADLNELIGSDEEVRVGQLEAQIGLLGQINELNQEKAGLEAISAQLAAVQAGADQTLIASQIQRIVNTRDETEALREKIREQLLDLGMTNDQIDQLKMFGKTAEEEMTRAEKATARLNEAFAKAAAQGLAQMATGFIDMAVNGTSFKQAILSPLADMAIQLGKTAISIGITMLQLRSVFSKPGPAIAAGVALLALGKVIKSSIGKSSSGRRSAVSSAASGRFTAPSFGAMSMVPTIGQGSVFQSQQFSPVPQGSQNVQLVASGRSLVSVVGSEMSASSRRVGGTPVSFSGVTAASGVFVDINRDDLVK